MTPQNVRRMTETLKPLGIEIIGQNVQAELVNIEYAKASRAGKKLLRQVILPEGESEAFVNIWQLLRAGIVTGVFDWSTVAEEGAGEGSA